MPLCSLGWSFRFSLICGYNRHDRPMVKRLLNILSREITGLHEAAFLLGAFALLAQFLGLVRDRSLAHFFGVGGELDIYYAAFRIPDLLFVSIASLVSLTVLIPILTEKMGKRDEARAFLDSIFTSFFFLMALVSIVAFFFMPQLTKLMFPGFVDEGARATLVHLARIILLSPTLLGVSNVLGGITQTHRKFFLYAISPVLYNFGIIVGILVFYPVFGVSGLGFGVVLGGFLHMGIQLPYILKSGYLPRFTWKVRVREIWRVAMISLPRTLALSMAQISFLVLLALASQMREGSIAVFNLSYNLQSVPVSIIGVSYSVAAFPILTRFFSSGARERFERYMVTAAKHIIFWSMPAFSLFIVVRAQIVRVILGSGMFSWNDTKLTAALLAMFAFSVVAQCISLLFIRGLYAAGETRKPLIVNLISSCSIIVVALMLVSLFNEHPTFRFFAEAIFKIGDVPGSVVLMLPLGYSLGMMLNALLLWILFGKKFKSHAREIGTTAFHSFGASIIMGAVSYGLLNVFDGVFDINTFVGIFLQGFLAGIGGIIVFVFVLLALKNDELRDVLTSLHRKFWKTHAIAAEQGEL